MKGLSVTKLIARLAGAKGVWLAPRGRTCPQQFTASPTLTGRNSITHARTLYFVPPRPRGGTDPAREWYTGGDGGVGNHASATATTDKSEEKPPINSPADKSGNGRNQYAAAADDSVRRGDLSALSVASARSREETRAIRSRHATRQLKKLPIEERDKFFSELQRSGKADVYHYSAMLSYATDSEQADKLLEQMTEAGVRPNTVTYNTLINKHQESGQLDRANELLESMRASGIRPDVVTFSSLIDGLSRSLRHRQAERLWSQMRDMGIQPDTATYNIVVRMYCRTHRAREARRTIADMAARNCMPTATTYTPLIALYGKDGDFKWLVQLLNEMHRQRVMLDMRAFQAVTSAITSMGHLPVAKALSAEAVAAATRAKRAHTNELECTWTGLTVAALIASAGSEPPSADNSSGGNAEGRAPRARKAARRDSNKKGSHGLKRARVEAAGAAAAGGAAGAPENARGPAGGTGAGVASVLDDSGLKQQGDAAGSAGAPRRRMVGLTGDGAEVDGGGGCWGGEGT